MPRLSEAIKKFLKEGDSFTWNHRNMPVYAQCQKDTGDFFCVSHEVFLTRDKNRIKQKHYTCQDYDEHTSLKQTHIIVWYCHIHQLMEEA